MFGETFAQPNAQNWTVDPSSGRQTPARATAPKNHADMAFMRAPETDAHTMPQAAEDWASDCLFDWYND